MTNSAPLLEVRGISKRFLGVPALSGVSLRLHTGEVLAVLGENGAGKSTLMKILAGVQQPDDGEIFLDGRAVRLNSVGEAQTAGIALIHQELNLADNLDVGANIFLGREPRRLGVIDKRRIEAESAPLLERVGLPFSPRTLVSTLSIGQQQMVEIAKAVAVNARVLIMDEPTSSLSQHETEQLFRVVRDLRASGVGIIYISHRLGEVRELADRVTVLRDGKNAGELARDEISHDKMVRLMIGRDVSQLYQRAENAVGETVLDVQGLRTSAHPQHALSFQVRAGEIVGVAGLVGAGRTELLETLFGVRLPLGGAVRLGDITLQLRSPQDAIAAGIALVPEDRKQQGLILEMACAHNLSLPGLHRTKRGGFLNFAAERALSERMFQELGIRATGAAQVVQFLSGGNQQKVVLGKWLAMEPRLLLLDEPTRGVDVGAKAEIYRLMEDLAGRGVAVLFVSSELEEIMGIADRALVMHEGRLSGELPRRDFSEEAIMHLATGGVEVTAA
jgi:ribose transport system ATP-binding protein